MKIINSVPSSGVESFRTTVQCKADRNVRHDRNEHCDGIVLCRGGEATSCGKALDVFDVEIFDENDMLCPCHTPGEIVVRGKISYAQMDGYYKLSEETLKVFRNLWYHTEIRL